MTPKDLDEVVSRETTSSKSFGVISLGTGNDGAKATGEGPNVCQAPSCSVKGLSPPNQGIVIDAFRPAWASCTPGTVPCALIKAVIRLNASACSSDQIPRSPREILPSGATAVAS